MITAILFIIFGFLSGSILYSYHLPKLLKHIDIVEGSKDHNPGTSNAVKQAGVPVGMMCLFFDLMKGFFPVYSFLHFINEPGLIFALVLSAPVLGHATAVFYKNIKGGKAIATSFGILLALIPHSFVVVFLIFWYLLFSFLIKIHPNERRTVITFFAFSMTTLAFCFFVRNIPVTLGCIIVSAIVIYRNKNRQTEKKLPFIHIQIHL